MSSAGGDEQGPSAPASSADSDSEVAAALALTSLSAGDTDTDTDRETPAAAPARVCQPMRLSELPSADSALLMRRAWPYSRPGNIVKPRTVSEPPEVPPGLLEEEDCPRLASVASVARRRRVNCGEDHPRRPRRRGVMPDKHSTLLAPPATPAAVPSPGEPESPSRTRRCQQEGDTPPPPAVAIAITVSPTAAAAAAAASTADAPDAAATATPSTPRKSKKHADRESPAPGRRSKEGKERKEQKRTHVASARFVVGVAETTGRRDEMEDVWTVRGRFCGSAERDLFLLLDGHCGRDAAEAGADKLPRFLEQRLAAGSEPAEALREAFRDTHQAILDEMPQCGTTATAILFVGSNGWVAHVGDTRVLEVAADGSARRATVDHRATNTVEAAAVRARGGFVVSLGGGNLRVNGMIAITRALGDKPLADALTCEPDVASLDAPSGAGAIVLACDGLWDCVSDEEAARVVLNDKLDCKQAAEELRDMAYKKGSFDNITVMVIRPAR